MPKCKQMQTRTRALWFDSKIQNTYGTVSYLRMN